VTKIDSGVTTLVGIVYHERADMHWIDVRTEWRRKGWNSKG
jgi:hypothetical protein